VEAAAIAATTVDRSAIAQKAFGPVRAAT
jgi:hypothetical protein